MSNPILSSAISGDTDFGAFVTAPAATEPETTQEPAKQEPVQETAKVDPPKETPKEPAKESEPKKETPVVKEPVKEAEKTEPDLTEKDSDIPVNPHFSDKPIADKPEGDETEKGISAWKDAKAEIKRLREQRDQLAAEAKVAKENATQTSTAEVEAIKQQLEEYKTKAIELERSLKAADVERTPEYVNNIKKPIDSLQADVRSIAAANDADFGKLWQAITEPDVRKRSDTLEELIGDFKRMDQLALVKAADKYSDLNSYKERFTKESESLLEQERARQAERDQEFIENDLRLQKTFTTKVWTGLEDRYDFLRPIEGQTEWNAQIEKARKAASETNLDRLSVEDRSAILARAAVVPFLESAVRHYTEQTKTIAQTRDAKIAELQSQLDALVGATPGLGGSKAEDDKPTDGPQTMDDVKDIGRFLVAGR
jgi:uncharacterized protein YdcH (DUF465 family)